MKLNVDKKNWRFVKLGDVVTKKEENDKENAKNRFTRFLRVKNLNVETLHIYSWEDQGNVELPPTFYKIFRKGQILYPTRNPHLRRAALASFDGICGEKTLTLEPNNSIVDPSFIPFLFHSQAFYNHTTSAIIGSTNPHVRWRDVANYEFLLPPLEEQGRLAELLWAMDAVVEREKGVLERLEVTKATMFNEMRKLRQRSYDLLENLSLKISSGGTPSRQKSKIYFEQGEIHWVKTKELNDGIIYDTEEKITEIGLKNSSAKMYPKNTILLAMYGATVGKLGVINNTMSCNQACCAIIPNLEKVDTWFLFYYLLALRKRLISLSVGSAQPNISASLIKKLKIPSIPLNEQKKFSTKLYFIDQTVKSVKSQITHSQSLQKSLINQIF
ncbi:restriction endonuclease subunit S [Saprospira grandis]|uniref:restriction endonuclease subunit S n=1 Tax=Saprospira grandis TaxID=1008 RepID=UPI0022DDEF7B|nr:restriction endonuclease subunit S [Saprospira grandis]WBM75337.1 restriction endonuclease subunit S [Saprospira grandis]